ncbi:hypothetical protein Droror1_Dr00012549 [Drosera rotundifolia]
MRKPKFCSKFLQQGNSSNTKQGSSTKRLMAGNSTEIAEGITIEQTRKFTPKIFIFNKEGNPLAKHNQPEKERKSETLKETFHSKGQQKIVRKLVTKKEENQA